MTVVPIEEARNSSKPAARVPPHSLEAERALLGAMLLSRDAIETAAEHIHPDDLYKPGHAHIFDAITHLHAAGEPADPVTVNDRLAGQGLAETCGGINNLTNLIAECGTTSNAAKYARIVADHARLRQLIAVGAEIAELGYTAPQPAAAVERAEQLVYQLAGTNLTGGPLEHSQPVIDRVVARLEQGETIGIPTGFVDLDERLLGLHPGQLITACGRPGMGKTAFGSQVAVNVACDDRTGVVIASIEMGTDELAMRVLASEASVDLQRIRSGRTVEKDWPRLGAAAARLGDAPLWFMDAASATIPNLRAEIRRLKARNPELGLAVVDYLQIVNVEDRRDNRQVDVSQISAGLKRIAREFGIAVLALAQLNRSCEMRADKRPILSDLRETGAIENDSDVVIGLYRDAVYNPESTDRGTAELIILKQRSGPTGKCLVAWLEHYTRFANMARV